MMFNGEEGYEIASNNSRFQQTSSSCCLPSSIMTSQAKSIMALPEMPLQHSVSTDMNFLSDSDEKPEDHLPAKTSSPNVNVQDVTQNQRYSSDNERDTQHKRSRNEVHNKSEKRRRSQINGKLKTLQELMPHCKKKDRSSILDEAANYIRVLQHQVETMSQLRGTEYGAQSQYMACSVNPGLQYPYAPMQQGAGNPGLQYPCAPMQQGAGMCVGCYARLSPFFQLPSPSSTVASFRDPSTRPLNED